MAQVTIYQHAYYSGDSQQLGPGNFDMHNLRLANDSISSLHIPNGLTVTLYEHAGFQGRSKRFRRSTPFVGHDFNDLTSSIIVQNGVSQPMGNRFVERVLELTNIERRKRGIQSLTFDSRLNSAAQAYSEEMALRDHRGHIGADGSRLRYRVMRTGYRYSALAENVAYGQSTPELVVGAWMRSAGHRRNILNPRYREIGIGYYFLHNDTGRVNYRHYWVQNFASPR